MHAHTPQVQPIVACQKWSMPRNLGPRCDSLFLGLRAPTLCEVLQGVGCMQPEEEDSQDAFEGCPAYEEATGQRAVLLTGVFACVCLCMLVRLYGVVCSYICALSHA